MYVYKKQNGLHCAVLKMSEIVQFSSMNKRRVTDWLTANNIQIPEPPITKRLRIPEIDRRKKK